MQGALLVLCILYKLRQRRLSVDDFGTPLHPGANEIEETPASAPALPDTGVPLTAGPETPGVAIADALGAAVERDVRTPGVIRAQSVQPIPVVAEESAPLLANPEHQGGKGWLAKLTGR
jgi:hypothetical protein